MAQRALTAAMATEVQAGTLRPVLFYEGEFAAAGSPSEAQYLRLWTGIGETTWDGKTWTGAGNLLSISPIEEKSAIEAIGFTVSLSGMPSANVSLALASVRQGKPGKVWLGAIDAAGAIIADPYLVQQGKFDVIVLEDDGEHCMIAAQYESRLVDLLRPRERHYTLEDQQLDYAGDLGFEYVPSLQDMELLWGGAAAAASPLAAPGGGEYIAPPPPDREQWTGD